MASPGNLEEEKVFFYCIFLDLAYLQRITFLQDPPEVDPKDPPYSSKVPYSALVQLFEKIITTQGNKKKRQLVTKFFTHYEDMNDIFAVLR